MATGEPMTKAASSGPLPVPERPAPARIAARGETRPVSLDPLIVALGRAVHRVTAAGREGAAPPGRTD